MDTVKARRLLILLHLFAAAFLAPVFLLVAISGGLHLLGGFDKLKTENIPLPAGASLDFKSKTLEQDVRDLLAETGIDADFEYIRNRGTTIQLRPTSRPYYVFTQSQNGLEATLNTPNLQNGLMELHKGHGPGIFKIYQKFVALGLMLVVLGGLFVGLLAPAYRRKTLVTFALGFFLFWLLAFVA